MSDPNEEDEVQVISEILENNENDADVVSSGDSTKVAKCGTMPNPNAKAHDPKIKKSSDNDEGIEKTQIDPAGKIDPESNTKILQENVKDISNKEKIAELLSRTNYSLTLSTGQRRYGGPPPGWEGPIPGENDHKSFSQIHIGKLGRRIFEDTLVPILEQFGKIYELRLMVNPQTGENKGFGFCVFSTKEEALNFQKEYDKKSIPENGGPITVTYSPPNMRLYVGGVPKYKSQEDIKAEFVKLLDGLDEVVMYNSLENKAHNRGFAFLQFKTHQDASSAKKKFASRKIQIFNRLLTKVDWADPLDEEEEAAASKTKTIFVRNLAPATDEAKLKELFKEFGEVGEIKKLKDYAFLTFPTRESAEAAQKGMDKKEIDGFVVEVDFSKTYDGGRKVVKKSRRDYDQSRNSYRTNRYEDSSPKRRFGESRRNKIRDYASGKGMYREPYPEYTRSRSPIPPWSDNDYPRSIRPSRYSQSRRPSDGYYDRDTSYREPSAAGMYGMGNAYSEPPYEQSYDYNRSAMDRPMYRDRQPNVNQPPSNYWAQPPMANGSSVPKNLSNPYPNIVQGQPEDRIDRSASYYTQRYSNPQTANYPSNSFYGARPIRPATFNQPPSNPSSMQGNVNFW